MRKKTHTPILQAQQLWRASYTVQAWYQLACKSKAPKISTAEINVGKIIPLCYIHIYIQIDKLIIYIVGTPTCYSISSYSIPFHLTALFPLPVHPSIYRPRKQQYKHHSKPLYPSRSTSMNKENGPSQAKPSQAKPSQTKPSQAKPSQDKVLTGGGDLRETQVDIPLYVSHSYVWLHRWAQ